LHELMEISQEVLERFYKPVMCVNARITRQVIILDHDCSKNRLGGSRSQLFGPAAAEVKMEKAKEQTSRGQKEDHARLPIVEVTAPDGSKSLWVAAVARNNAVAAVAEVIPANHFARLSRHRLTLNPRSTSLRRGEVRRIKL
jgi:hypothetical protein